MPRTLDGVEELRKKVDQARGAETYASIAFKLGESEQWLSNKLRGARKIDVPEVVRIAELLHADPVDWVSTRWPQLASSDRLAHLRRTLSDATDEEIAALCEVAVEMMAARPAKPTRRGRR